MSVNASDPSATPIVQIKLPWTIILGGAFTAAGIAISMWASVQQLTEEVRALKVAVQEGNRIVATLQNDVNLLKFRQERTEKQVEHIMVPVVPKAPK